MKIVCCQTNHMQNPIGFRMPHVTVSWKITEAEGKKQQAARVRVATDASMRDILFDTGWNASLDSLGVRLSLMPAPRTRYYWTVAVRSDAGEEAESEVQFFETGKMDEPWQAQWISCDSSQKRHPYFEKQVTPQKAVASARLYICGLGLYEAFYNGNRIGDEYFTPYSNNYHRWLQVQAFDVTDLLRQAGTLSVLLGNGWYKARFGFSAHEDVGFYGQDWKLIAELRIRYADGTEEVIGTDESWTVRRSNITFSNLYDGEHRNDTLPSLPVEQADRTDAPAGKLTDRMSTPVTVHEVLQPVQLIITPKGERVLDLGQEITGIFRLSLHVPRDTVVHIQTGEVLQQGCFYNENLRTAKSEYFYTSNGEPLLLQPHFTFYGFRYVKIEGVEDLKKEDFTALCLYSQIPQRGEMRTNHPLVNKLISNVRWGLKDNFLDVPTDCPQRDERMGWTGDAQVFSPTACFLQDPYAFYAKYLFDMWQEQQDFDGKVPDVIPSCGVTGTASVWGDAACIIPWNLYMFYGDKGILEDQYGSMKAWVDYIRRVDGNDHHWRDVFHYGDWLALDNMNGNAEAVFGATDEAFIANLYYAASAEIVSKAANVLGLAEDEKAYGALADAQYAQIMDEFFSKTGRCCVKTQTALLLTLKYHLSDNTDLTKRQLRKLFTDAGNKLRTGFVGTPLMCNILSDNEMEDLAWKLLLNEDYPGWLHEVKLGATTVWERWNSLLDDGTISGISMNSMNHYAYGSIVEWLFRHVAGMNVSERHPGCRHLDISPSFHWDLREQETVYDSAAGEYRSAWKIVDPTHVEVSLSVPFGCTATLSLPHRKEGAPSIHLSAGQYSFSYETDISLRPGYSVDSLIPDLLQVPEIRKALPMLEQIPKHDRNCTLREFALRYSDRIGQEKLQQLDQMLKQF